MITLLFLIIAFAMRGFFFHENDTWKEKFLYYVLCVGITPLFGAIVYKMLSESESTDEDDGGCYSPPPSL